ncbi:MAG: hypothetical protein AUJ52_14090 [Elusimicrobia bacterium CG1_02_63_36]|nr:MAG: hypothetical protein AUJ52_14090 [Elusimicrobia bacterium CG1_02_63_36]PIP81457.1 MAG: hypothetical protein COR54_20175 [Elusimicrobia bacterium CG22_combo_CG10-13_8_21_14_all_63_91]PJA17043.1 MAG: hypothetical protein COX66_05935 [Elusimicrobia bacterium CG_4_10_14_0_2_um_filter_63_34]PJB25073.1 MAG: hypothetical protein CO113_10425 [Elusimicrobia bacterium CG_4_9_14_3_um_filter_62_55]
MRLAGLVCAALLAAVPARAKSVVGESLEWLAVSRLEIGEYKLVEAKDRADPGARWTQRRFLLKRKSRIKGDPPKNVGFARSVALKTPKPGRGRRFLVFFDHHGGVDFVIDLERPGDTAPWERAFGLDFSEIRGRRNILKTLKRRIAYHEETRWPAVDRQRYVNGKPGSGYIKDEVPFNSEAHDKLFGGSSVYLVVPADSFREKELLDAVRDSETAVRARAAWRLANYHNARTETVLRELLSDPGTRVMTTRVDGNTRERVVYPVRQAAYRALTAMGVRVEKPSGYDAALEDSFLE